MYIRRIPSVKRDLERRATLEKSLEIIQKDAQRMDVPIAVPVGTWHEPCPVVGEDGAVYIVSPEKGYMVVINPDGIPRWEFREKQQLLTVPLLTHTGHVVVCGGNRQVLVFDLMGKLKARIRTTGVPIGHPAEIAEMEAIVVTTAKGIVMAVSLSEMRVLWETQVGEKGLGWPAIAPDGSVIAVSGEGFLTRLDPKSGNILWNLDLGEPVFSGPAVTPDGKIFVGTHYGSLVAVNLEGMPLGRVLLKGSIDTPPAIFKDRIYVVAGAFLYALTFDGSQIWVVDLGSLRYREKDTLSSFHRAIAMDEETLYVVTPLGLKAISHADGKELWSWGTEGTLLEDVGVYITLNAPPVVHPSGCVVVTSGPIICGVREGKLEWYVDPSSIESDAVKGKYLTEFVKPLPREVVTQDYVVRWRIFTMDKFKATLFISRDGKNWQVLAEDVGYGPYIFHPHRFEEGPVWLKIRVETSKGKVGEAIRQFTILNTVKPGHNATSPWPTFQRDSCRRGVYA